MSDELPTAARVSDPGIRALYKQENRWQAWLEVEVALARAQAELGIIPTEAATAIARAARLDLLDRGRIDEGFARTGHTIVPLVWELSRVVGEPHGGWVHWGATTQNITQTGDLLVLRQAHRAFQLLIGEALRAAADLAERGADMPIAGRTHGQHAVPATFGKSGPEIYTLMKTEFGEVEEPVPPGTVGSSTMPQKRNPKLCQDIIAAAAEVRSTVPLALEAMQTEHEADRTTSVMMDAAEARAAIATGDMLARLVEVLRGLRLDPARMRKNLDLGGGLIMAEAVMLDLGKTLGRQHAHDVVYDAAQAAAVEGKPFAELLAADRRVSAHLDARSIAALLDPTAYIGLCAEMARDGAKRARATAAAIWRD